MKIVVLTGAGISAESGISTFRDNNGLWEQHRIEDVATPEAFQRNPKLVHTFYNARREQLDNQAIAPNAAHLALVELEKVLGDDFLLITQNVDDLHQRAGSKNLLAMHGSLRESLCSYCKHKGLVKSPLSTDTVCPACTKKGGMRPNIVWFNEMPYYLEEIYAALASCDIFISIGTSGNVYPAAGFVAIANEAKAHTIELNLEPSNQNSNFAEHHQGPATKLVPQWVEAFMRDRMQLKH